MKSWLRSDDLIDVEQLFVVHFSNSILHCGINWDSSVLLFLLLPASSRHRFVEWRLSLYCGRFDGNSVCLSSYWFSTVIFQFYWLASAYLCFHGQFSVFIGWNECISVPICRLSSAIRFTSDIWLETGSFDFCQRSAIDVLCSLLPLGVCCCLNGDMVRVRGTT